MREANEGAMLYLGVILQGPTMRGVFRLAFTAQYPTVGEAWSVFAGLKARMQPVAMMATINLKNDLDAITMHANDDPNWLLDKIGAVLARHESTLNFDDMFAHVISKIPSDYRAFIINNHQQQPYTSTINLRMALTTLYASLRSARVQEDNTRSGPNATRTRNPSTGPSNEYALVNASNPGATLSAVSPTTMNEEIEFLLTHVELPVHVHEDADADNHIMTVDKLDESDDKLDESDDETVDSIQADLDNIEVLADEGSILAAAQSTKMRGSEFQTQAATFVK